MIPVKTTNCTWVNDGKSLTVTTKGAVGKLLFENEYEMTFPPNSKIVLGAMEFGRTECPCFESIGKSEYYHGAITNLKINDEIAWDGKINDEMFWSWRTAQE